MNNKTIIERGFRIIWRMEIKGGVIRHFRDKRKLGQVNFHKDFWENY